MDNKFLEAYIHLEKLCSEMYGEEHGITRYIEDMETGNSRVQSQIPAWTATYKKLKELRWKRNQYVHDGIVAYDELDIAWLRQFYQLIMEGKDPLSSRYKLQKPVVHIEKEVEYTCVVNHQSKHKDDEKNENSDNLLSLLLAVGLAILILWVIGFVVIFL